MNPGVNSCTPCSTETPGPVLGPRALPRCGASVLRRPHSKASLLQRRKRALHSSGISSPSQNPPALQSDACVDGGEPAAGAVQAMSWQQNGLELSPHASSSPITPPIKHEDNAVNIICDSAVTAPSVYSSQPVQIEPAFEHTHTTPHAINTAPIQHLPQPAAPDAQNSSSSSHPVSYTHLTLPTKA